jgi:putative transposase
MRRINIYRLLPDRAQQRLLSLLLDRGAALWNVAQHRCRQAFFAGERVPSYSDLCATLIGHATYRALPSDIAQEVLKKVAESWKSSRATLSAYTHGTIKHKPSLPGYWKDRKTGHRLGKCIPIKCPRAYRVDAHTVAITLPRDLGSDRLVLPLRGQARWTGKLGRADLLYDAVRRRWSLHVSVDVAEPARAPRAEKWAAIDPGARMTVAVAIEGTPDATLYRSRELWKDFRYWGRRIAALQSQLAPRGLHTSRRLRRAYQQRHARLTTAYRALARMVVDHLKRHRVTDIAFENQTGIRDGLNFGRNNELLHNFWAFAKLANAVQDACERAGIRVHPIPRTQGASSHCALCADATAVTRRLRSRVRCPNGHRLHADANAAWNLLASHSGTILEPEVRARAAGRPRWTTHRWNLHRWVATESRQSADLARVA